MFGVPAPVLVPGLLATDRRHTERMFKYFPSPVLVSACCRLGSADTAAGGVTLSMMTTTVPYIFNISFILIC